MRWLPGGGGRPRAGRVLAEVALGIAGLALAGLAGEWTLREFCPQRSASTLGMFREDPAAGYRLRENFGGEVRVVEYRTRVFTDADGLRVPANPGPDRLADRRILAIGDSFTFGVGVEAAQAFPEVLERLLVTDGRPSSVRNGGVGGYGPLRASRLLSSSLGKWNPEIVVHTIYVGNDLEDPEPDRYLSHPRVVDGRLVSDGRHPLFRLRKSLHIHSHLYSFLRERLYGVYRATGLAERSRHLDPVGLAEWPARILRSSWPAGRDAVRDAAEETRELGGRYLVVVAPTRYQVDDDSWRRYRDRWRLPDSAFDRDHAQREIVRDLQAMGVAVLDLLPGFRREAACGTRAYFDVDEHWTREGHRIAAEEIAEELRRLGWIDSLPREEIADARARSRMEESQT
ncbi:MAG: hypothetical protein QF904_04095 [Gemmatimonadota bacterium]|nr:hypothetical protein [Gemmatimonadota bacterium]